MMVVSTWTNPRSPYNRIGVVDEGKGMKDIPLSLKLYLTTKYYRRTMQTTKHLHLCSISEEMDVLKDVIMEYDRANNLPEKVGVVGSMFQIDSVLIQRECHEKMMASFNRIKNAVNLVKKP